jgi:catechol 2,3-dioxygenase-like lactoylglutathione lyase family enzyme
MTGVALGMVTLVVPNYDDAIDFFIGKLGFRLTADRRESESKRWVEVEGNGGARLLLARAADDAQAAAIGNQTGGRVGFFLYTEDFSGTHRRMLENGVRFAEEPRHEAYGTVAVFADHLGNHWDLIELAKDAQ